MLSPGWKELDLLVSFGVKLLLFFECYSLLVCFECIPTCVLSTDLHSRTGFAEDLKTSQPMSAGQTME